MPRISRDLSLVAFLFSAEIASAAQVAAPSFSAHDDTSRMALSMENINPLLVKAEYAVRGRLLDRAKELEDALEAGESL